MSKVRVYELAKELNKSSKAIVEKAHTMGIDVNNHMSSLEDDEVVKIQNAFKGQKSAPKRPVETREKNRKAEANQKPQGQKPQGQKPQGQKPQGQKPQGQKPQGQKPQGQKPQGQKPSNKPNNKPANKPQQKPQGNKTAVAKTEAKESASKRRDHSGGTQQKDFRKGGNRNTGGRKRGFEKKKRTKYKKERVEEVVIEDDSIIIPAKLSVGDLAERLNKNANEIIMKLMGLGVMAALNAEIDFDTAELIANEYEIPVKKEIMEGANIVLDEEYDDTPEQMVKRAPVVTVMGHVDHGKTSLLDAIRSSGVADGEAGGITQHIGASEIVHNGEKIVFLDTPGHEAFTTLRARGAQITDIAILVVAADDGVMPQTIEAIDHAKAAGVPIIVALNKIDKANANPDFVKKGLSENGILIEEWGGDIICVPVSALKGENIEQLLEMVLIVAEMEELRANPNRPAVGTIIEAKVEKGRGSVATILIEKGTMKVGDSITAGSAFGRVRAMFNHLGKKVTVAGPATSVEVIGLGDVPQAGDKIYVTKDDKRARYLAESNADILRERMMNKTTHVSLDDLFSQIMEGSIKDLNIIIKADVHGSVEAIRQSLMKLSNDEVRVNIIHGNVGTISESDIMLAASSNAIIIGFNVRPSASVSHMAEAENVDLRTYRIIYDAINDVETAMKGMLDPEFKEVVLGQVEVRETFKVPNVGVIAGGYVINGKVARNAEMRLVRDGIVIFEGKVSSLRRFKDDVKEVAQGYECGIGLERYNDLKEGDIIEAFIIEEIKRS